MQNAIYSFRSSDGDDHDLSLSQLEEWVKAGKLGMDQTVTDFFSGQSTIVRELLRPAPPVAPVIPPQYAAYPRTVTESVSSEDIRGFNWGAFAFTWIWGLNHKKPILLLMFLLNVVSRIPGVWFLGSIGSLVAAVYVGTNGNRWAWESGRFSSVDEMYACQRVWRTWFFGYLGFLLFIFIAIFIPNFLNAMHHARLSHG